MTIQVSTRRREPRTKPTKKETAILKRRPDNDSYVQVRLLTAIVEQSSIHRRSVHWSDDPTLVAFAVKKDDVVTRDKVRPRHPDLLSGKEQERLRIAQRVLKERLVKPGIVRVIHTSDGKYVTLSKEALALIQQRRCMETFSKSRLHPWAVRVATMLLATMSK